MWDVIPIEVPDHAAEICCSKLQSSHWERRWWMRDRPGVFPPSLRSGQITWPVTVWQLKFDHRNSPDIPWFATFEWAIVSSDGQFWYLMVWWILKLFTPRIGWSADTTNPLWWLVGGSPPFDVMGNSPVFKVQLSFNLGTTRQQSATVLMIKPPIGLLAIYHLWLI